MALPPPPPVELIVSVLPEGVIVMLVPAASVIFPFKLLRLVTDGPAPAAAVVWVVPSGNLKPPVVDSTSPATVSFDPGALVPMPTFALLPSTSELLCETTAFAPRAVALVRFPLPTFAPPPMAVLLSPVVLEIPASSPKNELPLPLVVKLPARMPKKLLSAPVVLFCPASDPKKLVFALVLSLCPAAHPK